VGLLIPFSIFLLVASSGLPVELFDAASIDGALHWHADADRHPLSAPALVTLVVVNTLWVWN